MEAGPNKLSRLFLRFPQPLEREYQEFFVQRNLGFARAAFAFGLFLYVGFASLDYFLSPTHYPQLWFVRLLIGTPVLAGVLAFMFTRWFSPRMQPVLTGATLFIAVSLVYLNVISFFETGEFRFFSVIIVNMYLHTFSRVQWAWAVPAGFANVLFYNVSLLFVVGVNGELLITANYLMLSSALAGMVACYMMELTSRREFFNLKILSSANAKLHESSSTDPLTGLANRRLLLDRLREEHARQQRTGKSYCIAMIDADHFKRINDEYGHASGDEVLKKIAMVLRDGTRVTDTTGRWGGEEFLVIFSATSLAAARIAAEKIRRNIENMRIFSGERCLPVTITIGIAEAGFNEKPDTTLRRADQALYEGKQSGRNRTVVAAPVTAVNPAAGVGSA